MMNNAAKILGLLFLTVGFIACDSNKVYEEYIAVNAAFWANENLATFEFTTNDTTHAHNLYINVRNTNAYPYSNLYLFVDMRGPNGNLIKDTVNCILASKRGKWLGNGIGNLWDLKIPYVGGFKFAQPGVYTVTLAQAMRVEEGLKGIADIGLRVEKAN